MLYLKKLSVSDGEGFYSLLQRIERESYAMHNVVNGESYGFYKAWLSKMNDWDLEKNLPEGYVRQTTYWLMKEDEPIGICRIRYKLTDSSREYGGSFGYSIAPEHRKHGYGTLFVKLILEEMREKKINEIISMVAVDNVASNKIMLKNNGKLFRQNSEYNYYEFKKV